MTDDEIDPCLHPTVVPFSEPPQCGVCGRRFQDREARSIQQYFAQLERATEAEPYV